MFVVKFALLEIAGAAERNSPSMTKNLPLPLRSLYRDRRAWAANRFTSDKIAVEPCREISDFSRGLA